MIVKIKDASFMTFPPKKRQPKKAPTKAKERFATGAKRTPRYLRSALDTAIERGERLEKIARTVERLSGRCAFCFETQTALKRILKLAKDE